MRSQFKSNGRPRFRLEYRLIDRNTDCEEIGLVVADAAAEGVFGSWFSSNEFA